MSIPVFPGAVRKNDALFMYGALSPTGSVFVYEQSGVEIVHGPSCIAANEIFVNRCKCEDVPVFERRSGGGTVVLSPGVVVIVITGIRTGKNTPVEIFHTIHCEIIRVLACHEITGIVESGISDLAIRDKKILGSSLYMGSNPLRYYYQSSLLVSPDLQLMDRYLVHPPREPEYRKGRAHSHFCTTLYNEGFTVKISDICMWLSEEITLS